MDGPDFARLAVQAGAEAVVVERRLELEPYGVERFADHFARRRRLATLPA